MGFMRSGGKQVRLLFAAMLVMIGVTALAAPAVALDGPGSAVLLQADSPGATPEDVADVADDATDESVAALPATGNGASQDGGTSPFVIGTVGLISVVALGYLAVRLGARRS